MRKEEGGEIRRGEREVDEVRVRRKENVKSCKHLVSRQAHTHQYRLCYYYPPLLQRVEI